MKTYTLKQLQGLSKEKLQETLSEQQELLRQLRFQVGQAELKQVHQIKLVKKTIAQILTLL